MSQLPTEVELRVQSHMGYTLCSPTSKVIGAILWEYLLSKNEMGNQTTVIWWGDAPITDGVHTVPFEQYCRWVGHDAHLISYSEEYYLELAGKALKRINAMMLPY